MSGTFRPVEVGDLGGTLARLAQIDAARQQTEIARQQAKQGQAFDQGLAALAPALASGQGPEYSNALAQLAGLGARGATMALPLLQAERQRAEAADFWRQGGGAPAAVPAAAGPVAPRQAGAPPPEVAAAIEEASRETGIPVPILTAQLRQESNWNPAAVGRSGEIGVAQVMPATARQPGYGMAGVDPETLRDPRNNVLFGARYLQARGRAAGVTDWNDPAQVDRALAAYNGGGDPNYVRNVRQWLPQDGAVPAAVPAIPVSAPAAPAGVNPAEMALIERALAHPNPQVQQQGRARLEMLRLRQQNNPEQYVAATETIGGRQVQGQRNTRTGQFAPFPGQTGGATEGISVAQARATVGRLGPMVASGRLTPEMPEYNDYVMAYEIARAPQNVWIDDPQTPGIQRQVQQPGLNLDPARFPHPAGGQAGGATVPTQAGAQPAATPAQAGGVQITGTGLTADPPDAAPVNPAGVTRQSPNSTPTGEENLSAGYARRMVEAEGLLTQATRNGYDPGNMRDATAGAIAGGRDAGVLRRAAGNFAMSEQGQLYRQAQEDWVRAKLRRESGAVIGEDEMAREIQVYFPQPGDSPATIAQKAEARRVAIQTMRQASGRAATTVPDRAADPDGARRRRAEGAIERARRELGPNATDDAVVDRARGYMQ